jgi:hypothetical protein
LCCAFFPSSFVFTLLRCVSTRLSQQLWFVLWIGIEQSLICAR